ncbi:MAG: nitrogen regulation protein NR(II) [Gammaproteobacteria bacterium]|nr:nitrogen regulation protein NR(II) [Gammaproteobacteria bacterium]
MTNLNKVDVLDYLSTAVMVLSADLRVCYLNSAAESLLGCSEGRSAGSPATDLLSAEDHDLFDGFGTVAETGQSVTRRGAEFRTRDGSEVVADLTVSLEQSSGHLIVEFQPINRLIRINRDDHAVFSQETTRKLVRGLAHEIKNPLGGVRGAAQLLERELDEARLTEYTRVIIDEADRLKALVDRMLGPNREPETRPVNVHSVIEHVIRLIDAESSGRIAFRRDYDPSLPEVRADEAQLIQAMLNIVANAAQALEGRANPTISIRTRIVRQFTIGARLHRIVLQIDIADNGPGIPADMLERMYFPMISGRPEGTGLGLAITQAIIGAHGGIIECESRPGRTCFSIFLPVEGAGVATEALEEQVNE